MSKSVRHFLLGFSIAQILMHGWLKFSNMLPLDILGFTITPSINNMFLLGWVALAILLLYMHSNDNKMVSSCDSARNRPL